MCIAGYFLKFSFKLCGKKRMLHLLLERRKKYKHALFTQIAIHLKFVWLINTFPTWCIINHEMDPLAYVNSYLHVDGVLFPGGGGALPHVTLICNVTYTLPLKTNPYYHRLSLDSFWIIRSQRSRRRDNGL